MTEAVPLGELLHVEAPFGLNRRQKGGSTPTTLIPVWTFPLRHISRVVWAWPDPLPARLKRVGKNVQTLWLVLALTTLLPTSKASFQGHLLNDDTYRAKLAPTKCTSVREETYTTTNYR